MRQLLYVPIFHAAADLGSAAAAVAGRSAALADVRRWELHREAESRFWGNLRTYLQSLPPARLKLYQDGMAAEGELGRRIVEQAAARGSENYALLLALLQNGAELRRTEDIALLLEEQQRLHDSLQRPSGATSLADTEAEINRARLRGARLLTERDQYIAAAISATLQVGEVGVLLIGADHRVAPLLARDIAVELVKDPLCVRGYVEALLLGRDERRLQELRAYLLAPIDPNSDALRHGISTRAADHLSAS